MNQKILFFFKYIYRKLIFFGFDPKKFLSSINPKNRIWVNSDFKIFKKQKGQDKSFKLRNNWPVYTDKNDEGGTMKGHYFHQDLYAARLIFKNNPKKHLDIGSRTDGFVAHIACFREIEVADIRNISSKVKNISFMKCDLMDLDSKMINYCDSISSLHAIEHFGLGRYGDPIDYWGFKKAIHNIHQILKINGLFYFSVPIGPQKVEFNAHRIFSVKYLIKLLSELFEIKLFSYVDDIGDFHENVEITKNNIDLNFSCNFGCGIFILQKT